MLTLLFDADMIVYQTCAAAEIPINWGEGLWTLHADERECCAAIDNKVGYITERVLGKLEYTGEYKILMCFSDTGNFRKKILPTYKANRIGKRKPVCYYGVQEWVLKNYIAYLRPELEADDCIGILSTQKKTRQQGGRVVIVSGDKDFKTLPDTDFYDYIHDTLTHTTAAEADYNFFMQTLTGDVADNYIGCRGVGEKTARTILDAEGATWETVVKTFESRGFTKEDALIQARVARILRATDYDFNAKQPILWKPTNTKKTKRKRKIAAAE